MSTVLPDPQTSPALFDSVLPRRVMAYGIDLAIMGFLVLAATTVGFIAGFLTFGLAWLALVVVIPAVIIGYYASTLGSARRATVGMQAMDLVLTPTRGQPLDGPWAFLHAGLFWITICFSWPLSLAIALFTSRQQMLHDLALGVLMLRRSPMERHWAGDSHSAA